MKKLVVFDIDGTILDSYTLFRKVVATYSRDNNLQMPCLDTIVKGYGAPLEYDFKWGVDRETQKKYLIDTFIMTDAWSISGEAEKTPGLFSGVEDMLVHLKDLGYTLAIVTSKAETPLLHLLEYHNVRNVFSAHRTWDDIKRRKELEKPAPDMLHSVMRDLSFKPEETVMIGDTTMDIRMGVSANTSTVGVTWGAHTRDMLVDAGAHSIVDTHIGDLVPAVGKFFS